MLTYWKGETNYGCIWQKDNISLKNKQCEGCLLGLSDDGRFYVINCKKNGKKEICLMGVMEDINNQK